MKLQVVCFDVPYPPNYGGVIDVYAKLRALSKLGAQITLHCFSYGRRRSHVLEELCSNVFYYPRKTSLIHQLSKKPYIVRSRTSNDLLHNLAKLDGPILFEGLHTCAYLGEPLLANKPRWVRLHNIEHHYYEALAVETSSRIKKIYYQLESWKLKHYEAILRCAEGLFSISKTELEYFKRLHPNTHWLPAFHLGDISNKQTSHDNYHLINGDFTIEGNANSAIKLCTSLQQHITICLSGRMTIGFENKIRESFPSVLVLSNPSSERMEAIIRRAKSHIVLANHNCGVKLKLIHALATARPVFCNEAAVIGSGLQSDVCLFRRPDELHHLMQDFSYNTYDTPSAFIQYYNNEQNAKALLSLMMQT